MPRTMEEFTHPGSVRPSPGFPDAPESWSPDMAERLAQEMGIELTDDHWEVIRTLQGAYRDEAEPPLRRLHEALEGRFAEKGGMKYLYAIFNGGPIARGCRLAGLKPPAGAIDTSFGSEA